MRVRRTPILLPISHHDLLIFVCNAHDDSNCAPTAVEASFTETGELSMEGTRHVSHYQTHSAAYNGNSHVSHHPTHAAAYNGNSH
eukprot:1156467-Pelagomonas_calceolata.AAC.6